MPEEEIEQREEEQPDPVPETAKPHAAGGRRRYFTRRNAGISAGIRAVLAVLLAVLSVVFYKYGVFDNYVKTQFIAKMARIGIVFDADVFRVTVYPLELELKNATFNDRVSGEKLFFIRDAHLGLTVQDLYAWQLNRDITHRHDRYQRRRGLGEVRRKRAGRTSRTLTSSRSQGQTGQFPLSIPSISASRTPSFISATFRTRSLPTPNNVQFLLEPEDPTFRTTRNATSST